MALAAQSGLPRLTGGLRDTDAFMRLIRVEELWQDRRLVSERHVEPGRARWAVPALDAAARYLDPAALLLHLGGMAMERAIYWSGALISPVLQIVGLPRRCPRRLSRFGKSTAPGASPR